MAKKEEEATAVKSPAKAKADELPLRCWKLTKKSPVKEGDVTILRAAGSIVWSREQPAGAEEVKGGPGSHSGAGSGGDQGADHAGGNHPRGDKPDGLGPEVES